MTRKEAIARIREHKIIHKMNEPRAIRISEALDMAIQALEQEPCEDWHDVPSYEILPSVTPQQKMGRWLVKSFHEVYCNKCGFDFDIMKNEFIDKMVYCPNCGTKMQEVEE